MKLDQVLFGVLIALDQKIEKLDIVVIGVLNKFV